MDLEQWSEKLAEQAEREERPEKDESISIPKEEKRQAPPQKRPPKDDR